MLYFYIFSPNRTQCIDSLGKKISWLEILYSRALFTTHVKYSSSMPIGFYRKGKGEGGG
jgi:hypothetical protein